MLDKKIKLYIPSTVDVNKPNKELQAFFTDTATGLFASQFGGANVYDIRGAWVDSENNTVVEDITIVESFYDVMDDTSLINIKLLAERIKADMTQEAVSLEINNVLEFI